ncbi:HTH domain-containing protein [Arthrobacter sp. zg-Y1110]|uniref:HTH domain-containing protein n=1 Tax=Arthrobacter sp. zg-Y1110 TaxID=2886932 RepID=UPI001D15199C|nr:HTH domain-containing protein [Arthrobacter sp. zg-Y1110]MCC3292853.1 helix-turn-helix domain-containing protein [Arthrobacter sp. zg-Y1110]UWX86792.1 helix-turn-helix domain-containing protein [Arthrobacter sp. zg-Y1110]
MTENTRDVIRGIAAADKRAQPGLINTFISERWGLFKQIAWSLCRNFGVSVDVHGDDFTSMVAEEAYKMLMEHLEDDDELQRVEVWEAMLKLRSRQVVRNYLDREMAPAAEMTSALRRVRLLNQTRDSMRMEMRREPSDREVVESHNDKMRRTRSNAVKQGVIATVEDLRTYRACADVDDHDRAEPIDTEFVLHPVEGPRFIKMLVQRTMEHNKRLGTAAELWLGGLYGTEYPPRISSVEEIADAMGVSRSTARSYIRKIKEYAVTVAQEEFDISGSDV